MRYTLKTYLLTWNPEKWQWTNLEEAVVEANLTGNYSDEWSCGVNKHIRPGDRIFLIRLGKDPKVIIGSGFVTSDVFLSAHWDDALSSKGKLANRVNIEFDILSEMPIITDEELEKLSGQRWFPQSSGISMQRRNC